MIEKLDRYTRLDQTDEAVTNRYMVLTYVHMYEVTVALAKDKKEFGSLYSSPYALET